MYQKIVEMRRKTEKLRCMLVVPVLVIFAFLSMKLFPGSNPLDVILRWALPLVLLAIAGITLWDYLHFDRDLEKMKQVVGAHSDFEMSALLEQSMSLENNTYFISELYVLNFFSVAAYPRSEIKKIEDYVDVSTDSEQNVTSRRYCLRIHYGEKSTDRMIFNDCKQRDTVRKILEN